MLVSNQIINRIDEIIERSYLAFTHRLVGKDVLSRDQITRIEAMGILVGDMPLIELLYLLVRQRDMPNYKKDKTLNSILEDISRTGVLPTINEASQYTIEHGKQRTKEAVEQASQELKTKIKDEILQANTNYKEQQIVAPVIPVNQERERYEDNANKLIDNLKKGAVVAGVVYLFRREFTDMMTNLVNSATIDHMQSPLPGIRNQDSSDPLVYKQVVNDDRLSPECRRLHTYPDGSPRIYKLSELIANGTNDGKARSQWKAVVGGTHPNCRCTLRPAGELDSESES